MSSSTSKSSTRFAIIRYDEYFAVHAENADKPTPSEIKWITQ